MKIKRVEIVGFKSFVEKTSLDFQPGVTGVVGPNGCGKSNIVDAIRWCLGEQSARNLRGRAMEDVIFGGSEKRKPLGMAEVSITFSNEDGLAPPRFRDFAEITVTRRLHRSGESEYLINKTSCRLLDIVELVMDTGVGARAYSIIEQGKIGQILNAKPEERRFLIEEAAGISKFKARKKTALRKIDATRQNLIRLGDIISEVRRQMANLKRQAQKAERFRALRDEMRALETRFAQERYAEIGTAVAEVEARAREVARYLAEETARLEAAELQLEENKVLLVGEEKEVQRSQEQIFELTSECQRIEQRVEFSQREQDNLEQQKERLEAEAAEVRERLARVAEEQKRLHHDGERFSREVEAEGKALALDEAELRTLAEGEKDFDQRIEETRRALFAAMAEMSRLESFRQEVRRRLAGMDEREARNRADAVNLREQIEEARRRLEEARSSLEGIGAERSMLVAERTTLQERLALLRREIEESESRLLVQREELSRHSSRLDSLRELEKNLEGYGSGVRTLLTDSAFAPRLRGMVADLMDVPADLERAVEAILAERLQALAVNEVADARVGLGLLGESSGRVTFLLSGDGVPAISWSGGAPLADRVRARGGAESTVQRVLAGVYLVEDLDPFFATVLPAGATLVTREGKALNFRGEFSGGTAGGQGHGLLQKKREVAELTRLVAAGRQALAELQTLRGDQRDEIRAVEENLQEIGAALHRQELQTVDRRKELERLQADEERCGERLEVLSFEEDQLHEEREALARQLEQASAQHEEQEGRWQGLEDALAQLQGDARERRQNLAARQDAVTTRKVRLAGLEERVENSRQGHAQLERMERDLLQRTLQVDQQLAEGSQRHQQLEDEREQLGVRLEILRRRREGEKIGHEELRQRFDQRQQRIHEQEALLKGLRERLGQHRQQEGSLQLRIRELTLEGEHLRATCQERYHIDLDEGLSPSAPFDPVAAERRLEELRRSVETMGEVNLTAIEQYEELDQRHRFLTTQQNDLRESMDDLQKAINKINRTTRSRFRETFEQVNLKFQEVFPRLFRGGRAELVLTDENDLLETGIDITVQPPGKKLQNVTLLSGGEKALAAVALIFAIFLVKPSPFCLLDEVDAPLDDANIGRFNDMIAEMSDFSQFIVITHNKKTMEIADPLYGVTMEEPGVSKIVSVRMNEL